MTDPEDIEDNDEPINMDAAVNFRKLLRGKALDTFDPLHQSMLDMEILADNVGINLDYDQDFSDISDDW